MWTGNNKSKREGSARWLTGPYTFSQNLWPNILSALTNWAWYYSSLDLIPSVQYTGSFALYKIINWVGSQTRSISYKTACPPSEDSDQSAYPRSLIRVFVARMKTSDPWQFTECPAKILISLRECAGWSESSLGAHTIFVWNAVTRLNFNWIINLTIFIIFLLYRCNVNAYILLRIEMCVSP